MKLLFGGALQLAVLASVGAAYSADMPVKAPMAQFVPSWSGVYVGGNFGYGIGRARTYDNIGIIASTLSPAGVIGGGQVGYRVQREWFVVGVEADIQWSGQQESALCFFSLDVGCRSDINSFRSNKLDWFGTVRGTAGFAHDNWLWYVTGGYAYGQIDDHAAGNALGNGQVGSGGVRVTKGGWTIGGGVETRFRASNWSAKLEYLYANLGRLAYDANNPSCAILNGVCDPPVEPGNFRAGSSIQEHVFRIGLNYNLGNAPSEATPTPRASMHAAGWGGFYVGGNFGYGVAHDHLRVERIPAVGNVARVFSSPLSPADIVGGGQIGYRIHRDWLVLGAEADFQRSARKDVSCHNCLGAFDLSDEKLHWFGTVRGVVGFAQNNWLWYVTGGYAYGRASVNHTFGVPNLFSSAVLDSTRSGWTGGVGAETKLWGSKWSARLEYLYTDFGKVSFDSFCSDGMANLFGLQPGRCAVATSSISDHVIRVGLNYNFGS